MSDILIGVIVLVAVFGGALFGMFLRRVLPDQHLSTDARDVIRIVMAMLATLSAVVLGLLTGSAINSLAEKETELRNAAVQFILLDRTLASYGPETSDARKMLKQLLTDRMSLIWPEKGGSVSLAVLGGGPGSTWFSKNSSRYYRRLRSSGGFGPTRWKSPTHWRDLAGRLLSKSAAGSPGNF